jgi:sugar lactone lactonase YvrE
LSVAAMSGLVAAAAGLLPADEKADSPLKPSWVLKEGFDTPESACYDPDTNLVYVSNIAGKPDEKDGKGWISRVDPDGKLKDAKWVEGLNAPKGIRIAKGVLWVSDLTELVAIDIGKGEVVKRVEVPGAKFLNDVAIDGVNVYVSDTFTSKVYRYDGKEVTVFAEGDELESPNGLLIEDGKLVVAAWGKITKPDVGGTDVPGRLYTLDLRTKKRQNISPMPLGNLDGLEADGGGNYLVSDWVAGRVYRVTGDGKPKGIIAGVKGPADFAYIGDRHLLVLPAMRENAVYGFDLAKQE